MFAAGYVAAEFAVAEEFSYGGSPDKEFVAATSVGVSSTDQAAPHAAVIDRKGRRVRHAVTPSESRPVVCGEGLQYSCLGARVILRPFFSVTAVGAAHTGGISISAVDHMPVDVG